MGADNIFLIVKGGNQTYVRRRFKEKHENDLHEYGHDAYAGTWGNVDDVKFTGKTFKSKDEAMEYLYDNCKKWDDGLVVEYRNSEGQLVWMIGACVAC